MKKTGKLLLASSIVLNVLLATLLFYGYSRVRTAHEELVYTEVSENLIALNGLILREQNSGWDDPVVVTSRMGDLLSGLATATNHGTFSGLVTQKEAEIIGGLFDQFRSYPHDNFFMQKSRTLSDRDQEKLERLREWLTKAGFRAADTSPDDWDSLIRQLTELLESLQKETQ